MAMSNPLLSEFNTPFSTAPFSEISNEHFLPAFESAILAAKEEIDAITNQKEAPSFENTIFNGKCSFYDRTIPVIQVCLNRIMSGKNLWNSLKSQCNLLIWIAYQVVIKGIFVPVCISVQNDHENKDRKNKNHLSVYQRRRQHRHLLKN